MDPIKHTRRDALLKQSKALPATGATAYSDAIDLKQACGLDGICVELAIEATPNLAATKTMSLTLETSSDGSTWSALGGTSLTATGGTSGGAAAASATERISIHAKRYIRAKAVADASAGNNTAANFSVAVLV